MTIATFLSIHFAFVTWLLSSHDHAHIIPATIIKMKHTTKIRDMIILVNAHTILGNAVVGFVSLSLLVHIQFHMIGKFVLSFIQSHPDTEEGICAPFESEEGFFTPFTETSGWFTIFVICPPS